MLAEFRSAVYDHLATAGLGVGVWDVVPDDPAELPCLVVGRPSATRSDVLLVFDVTLDVWVIGRRQAAGAAEAELLAATDAVLTALGGTRGKLVVGGDVVTVESADPRLAPIAGQDYPAFSVTVSASTATC